MALNYYTASTAGTVVAAAGTAPFFIIQGSATNSIRVKKITIQGPTLTAVEYLNIIATRYSTAISGGTPTALVSVPKASSYAASTQNLLNVYTAAPTAGTAVGTVASARVLGQATTAAAAGTVNDQIVFDFGTGIILKGAAEGLGVRFANAPATAVTLALTVEFDEE